MKDLLCIQPVHGPDGRRGQNASRADLRIQPAAPNDVTQPGDHPLDCHLVSGNIIQKSEASKDDRLDMVFLKNTSWAAVRVQHEPLAPIPVEDSLPWWDGVLAHAAQAGVLVFHTSRMTQIRLLRHRAAPRGM